MHYRSPERPAVAPTRYYPTVPHLTAIGYIVRLSAGSSALQAIVYGAIGDASHLRTQLVSFVVCGLVALLIGRQAWHTLRTGDSPCPVCRARWLTCKSVAVEEGRTEDGLPVVRWSHP